MKKVLLAMSGGIDSSVSAMLLQKSYDITGITFECCDVNYRQESPAADAHCLAEKLGIEHHIIDVRQHFRDTVISNFISEYMNGRTPNPCVVCNRNIKWGRLLTEADALGCNYLATGHYAQIVNENGRYFLRKGIDLSKDQTYFLWRLTQDNLARTIFPLGKYTKNEIREIATQNGYVSLTQKRESQEICFVPNDDYRAFLRAQVPDIDEKIGKGRIYFEGKKIGMHNGFPFYTIGQRKGLEVAVGHPVYVTEINAAKNTVTLGEREELLKTEIVVSDLNFMKYDNLETPRTLICKIRYNNAGVECEAQQIGNQLKITFAKPVSAVTPGQSAVLYEGDDVVAGGIIE